MLPDAVELADGRTLPADLVLLSIGVRPETALARAAGLEIGERGGIAVDDAQRTSDPDIYAVGDAAEKRDALTGDPVLVPLANLANRHGRLVADALTGREVSARPATSTAIVKIFGLTAAATGWNEKRLRAAGHPYQAGICTRVRTPATTREPPPSRSSCSSTLATSAFSAPRRSAGTVSTSGSTSSPPPWPAA